MRILCFELADLLDRHITAYAMFFASLSAAASLEWLVGLIVAVVFYVGMTSVVHSLRWVGGFRLRVDRIPTCGTSVDVSVMSSSV